MKIKKENIFMKEQLEKDLKKQKKIMILSALGFVVSLVFIVVLFMLDDKQYIALVAVLAIDVYELIKYVKLYKTTKKELEKINT